MNNIRVFNLKKLPTVFGGEIFNIMNRRGFVMGEADRTPNNEAIVMDSVYFWDAKL